jgi:outer membrane cobalamin receptor
VSLKKKLAFLYRHLRERMILYKIVSTKFLAIFLMLYSNVVILGQSNIRLSGYVYDASDGSPLPGVLIKLPGTSYYTTTDHYGYFRLENVKPGMYALHISSLGFSNQIIHNVNINEENSPVIQINLKPKPLVSDTVLIVGKLPDDQFGIEGNKAIISYEYISRFKNLGLTSILQNIAGIQIETTGGSDQSIYIRIHGSNPNQVLVLLDDQRLNNPQTGAVNLSLIPIESVETIEIIREGNTTLFGGNAFAGIVKIKTRKADRKNFGEARSQFGSFTYALGNLTLGYSSELINLIGSYQQSYSRQNFTYQYQNQIYERENAWQKSANFFVKASLGQTDNSYNILYNYYKDTQGLPSAFFEEMNHYGGSKKGDFHNIQMNNHLLLTSHSYIHTLFGFNTLNQNYQNTEDPSPYTRYDVDQRNSNYELKSDLYWLNSSYLESRWGIRYLKEDLNHKNLLYPDLSIGYKSRNSYGIYGGFEWQLPHLDGLMKVSKIISVLRYEKYFTLPGKVYPFIGLSVVPRQLPSISYSLSWAKAVRYPDFNSLFWKGDARAQGNPTLLPERKNYWNMHLHYMSSRVHLPEVSFYYFSENITDLIFWQRTVQGIWEPRNEQAVYKKGWDLQMKGGLIEDHFHLQIGYSYVQALNKSSELNRRNKHIVFMPEHSFNSNVTLSLKNVNVVIHYRYISEREITPSNTGIPLDEYHVWDYMINSHYLIGKFKFGLGFIIKNLTNTSYGLIRGYPMPGREFRINLDLQFNQEKE